MFCIDTIIQYFLAYWQSVNGKLLSVSNWTVWSINTKLFQQYSEFDFNDWEC